LSSLMLDALGPRQGRALVYPHRREEREPAHHTGPSFSCLFFIFFFFARLAQHRPRRSPAAEAKRPDSPRPASNLNTSFMPHREAGWASVLKKATAQSPVKHQKEAPSILLLVRLFDCGGSLAVSGRFITRPHIGQWHDGLDWAQSVRGSSKVAVMCPTLRFRAGEKICPLPWRALHLPRLMRPSFTQCSSGNTTQP